MIAKLQERLTDLKDGAEKMPKSLLDTSKATDWDRLSDKPDLTDPSSLRDSFDREEAATLYKTAVDKFKASPEDTSANLTSRDAQAAKLQSDLLSSLQQGFVMRYRSRIQMMADAASLRQSIKDARIELVHERQIANVEAAG